MVQTSPIAPDRVDRYSGGDTRLWARMAGLTSAVEMVNRGLAQLGPGRVREGLAAFKRVDDGTWDSGFLSACHGQAGRLGERVRGISSKLGHSSVEYSDVAEAMKMDEDSVRMIVYCYDEHPAVLHALAYHYVALGDALQLPQLVREELSA